MDVQKSFLDVNFTNEPTCTREHIHHPARFFFRRHGRIEQLQINQYGLYIVPSGQENHKTEN